MVMRNIVKLLVVMFTITLFNGCYDRGILDEKEFNHSLPNVENLNYSKQGDVVSLTWDFPATISDEFRRPLEVSIQVVENNIYRQKVIVRDENESVDITIDPAMEYRFVVKLLGFLTAEAREEGLTDRVYSAGEVIEIE
jgi:hypothetical protein